MIQIYLLCEHYKTFIRCTKYTPQSTDICHNNHIFKVVKVINIAEICVVVRCMYLGVLWRGFCVKFMAIIKQKIEYWMFMTL